MITQTDTDAFVISRVAGPGDTLDYFVQGVEWQVPRALAIRRKYLCWDPRPPESPPVRSGPGLLEDFVKLADQDDAAILRYAQRWGPLWLCSHGTPWQHSFRCDVGRLGGRSRESNWRVEELEHWRLAAREARAVLRLARRIQQGQFGEPTDWQTVGGGTLHDARVWTPMQVPRWDWEPEPFEWHDEPPPAAAAVRRVPGGRTLELQRESLATVLDDWLVRGGVRPLVQWDGAKPSVRLSGYSLYGAVATQLLFDAARTDGLAICTSCGTPFLPPSRRPRWDQNPYCLDCGRKASARDAAARYRRTEKYRLARLRRLAAARG